MKTNTQHTPGPWRMELIPSSAYESRRIVAKDDEGDWQTVANGIRHFPDARLIAAAPDLLAALEIVLVQFGPYEDGQGAAKFHAINIARAAIARAKGESK